MNMPFSGEWEKHPSHYFKLSYMPHFKRTIKGKFWSSGHFAWNVLTLPDFLTFSNRSQLPFSSSQRWSIEKPCDCSGPGWLGDGVFSYQLWALTTCCSGVSSFQGVLFSAVVKQWSLMWWCNFLKELPKEKIQHWFWILKLKISYILMLLDRWILCYAERV